MAGSYGAIREYRDDPDFRDFRDEVPSSSVSELTEKIRTNIFKINNGANAVDRATKNVGTDRDSSQLRDKIHETSQATAKIVQETTKMIRAAATKKADKQQKIQLDLLRSNFQEALQRFQTLQMKAAAKVKSAVKLGSKPTSEPLIPIAGDDDRSPLVREEELLQNQVLKEQEVVIEDDLGLIREREERIHQLESDILDVNEIFRELGAMVHAQGEVLDTIDQNLYSAADNVESGNEQLIKAAEYQRKSRRKVCCLLGIFLVIAMIITIIVVVSLKT